MRHPTASPLVSLMAKQGCKHVKRLKMACLSMEEVGDRFCLILNESQHWAECSGSGN